MGYIYLRKNLTNGKCYVGQTVDVKKRNKDWNNLNWEYGGVLIERARAKYGADGFSFELLKECPNEEMNYWEMYYIKEYNSKTPYGYNSTEGGEGNRGYTWSEEARKKISAALKGKPNPKLAAALRGRKLSPEHIERMAAALRGKKRTEEVKKKIAAAHRGKKLSEEHIAKMSTAHKGQKLSDETKKKISDALIGRKRPDIAAANSKPVQALNPKTLDVVMEFPSAMEAQRQYGFSAGHICECCLGKRKTAYGFIWRFAS